MSVTIRKFLSSTYSVPNPSQVLLVIILIVTLLEALSPVPFHREGSGLLVQGHTVGKRQSLAPNPEKLPRPLLLGSVRQEAGDLPGSANHRISHSGGLRLASPSARPATLGAFSKSSQRRIRGSISSLQNYEMPFSFLACVRASWFLPY